MPGMHSSSPLPRRRLLQAGSLLLGAAAAGCNAEPATLSAKALREDLQQWRHAVLQRHPRFHGQARLDAALEAGFDTLHGRLSQPLRRDQALPLFLGLNPLLRDAHTLLMPWPDGQEPKEGSGLFPFGVDLHGRAELHLRSSWQREADGLRLRAGTRLLGINGLGTEALLERLERCSHGETAILRRHMLSLLWPHWLHAVLGWRAPFTLQLEGQPQALQLQAGERWQALRPAPELPHLRLLGADAALLQVPTLDVDEQAEAFQRAVDAAFATLRQRRVQRLLIDLRGNTGGQSDAGAALLRPLLNRPIAQVSRAVERLNEDNNGLLGWRGAAGTLREIDLARDGQVQPLPEAQRFTGRVAVLIDELSYSATLLLATAVQDHRLGWLAGRASGGFANQTGNMMKTRLAHSGWTAFIATRSFLRPSGDRRELPVQPDWPSTAEGEALVHEVLARLRGL